MRIPLVASRCQAVVDVNFRVHRLATVATSPKWKANLLDYSDNSPSHLQDLMPMSEEDALDEVEKSLSRNL